MAIDYKIKDNELFIEFNKYNQKEYELFLKTKKIPEAKYQYHNNNHTCKAPARYIKFLGLGDIKIKDYDYIIPDSLFDYQKSIVKIALDKKRYAVYADTGLGKTLIFLTWSLNVVNKTGGNVLILSPLQIIDQTIDEAKRLNQ